MNFLQTIDYIEWFARQSKWQDCGMINNQQTFKGRNIYG